VKQIESLVLINLRISVFVVGARHCRALEY